MGKKINFKANIMKKVLVTGSEGFIGGYIVKELIDKNYYVIGIDNLSKYVQIIRNHSDSEFYEFHHGDVKDKNLLRELMHVEDVISRLKIALSENTSDKSAFISDKSVNINSIFLFLDSKIKKNNLVNLEYTENNYDNKSFRIDQKGINLNSLENGLESLLKL